MNRNVVIDIAKYIAAILVVAIHTRPFKTVSPEINFFFCDIICRFAVPFFAVCTGFYISSIGEEKGFYNIAKRSLYKIGRLYIFWSLIYLIHLTVFWIKAGSEITRLYYIGWMQGAVISFSFYHLWYLVAMCYGLCFFIIVKRFVPERLFVMIIIVLWLLQVCWYTYDDRFHLLPIFIRRLMDSFPAIFNGFTMMLPLLLVGYYIHKHNSYMSDRFLRNGFFLSFLGLIIEVHFLKRIGEDNSRVSLFYLLFPVHFLLSLVYTDGDRTWLDLGNTVSF